MLKRLTAGWIAQVIAAPRRMLFVTALVAAMLISGITRLEFDADTRAFIAGEHTHANALEQLETVFGRQNNLVVIVSARSGDLLEPDRFAVLDALTRRAALTPYSTGVLSIANYPTVARHDDSTSPAQPDTANHSLRHRILDDESLNGWLISTDGTVAAVFVFTRPPRQDRREGEHIADFARALQHEFGARHPELAFRLSGDVIADASFGESTRSDILTLAPMMAAAGVMMLLLGLRSARATLIVLAIMLGSALSALGVAGWVGIPLNAATAAAPAIIMALAAADGIHLLSLAREKLGTGLPPSDAVAASLRFNLLAIFMTTVTDVIGFMTLNLGLSAPLRDLGTLVSIGVVIAFLLSVSLAPALLVLMPRSLTHAPTGGSRLGSALAGYALKHRRTCFAGFLVVAVIATAGWSRVSLEDDFVRYFDESFEFRQDTEYMEQHLGGLQIVQFALPSRGPDGVTEPAYLREVAAFSDWLRAQPEVRQVQSLAGLLSRLQQAVGQERSFPPDRDTAAQLLLLHEMSTAPAAGPFALTDEAHAQSKLSITTGRMSSAELRAFASRAEDWLRTNAPTIASPATGLYLTYARVAHDNVRAMITGIWPALALIGLTMYAVFRSLPLAALSLVPNVLAAVVTIGLWGWLFGQVNLAVAAAAVASFGIIVDDTTHLFARYAWLRRSGAPAPVALEDSLRGVGDAICLTTWILIAGFLIQSTSGFAVSAQMGALTAMTIAVALIAEYCLVPTLLSLHRGHTIR